jgi:hypothetical protein
MNDGRKLASAKVNCAKNARHEPSCLSFAVKRLDNGTIGAKFTIAVGKRQSVNTTALILTRLLLTFTPHS